MTPPTEVLPGVHRIELPLPFELNAVNVYLVRLREGYLLVDSGFGTRASYDALTDALEILGVHLGSIRQLLLTHMHPDHMGLASKLLKLSGAQLLMHREEAHHLAEVAAAREHPGWLEDVLHEAGVPPDLIERIEASFDDIKMSLRKLDPDWVLTGGETISTSLGPLEVVWTPGHSPGHICLYAPGPKALFSGDHLLEHVTPNIGWLPEQDTLGDYLASLDLVATMDIELVLPAHSGPFAGCREWVQATKRHHADRCAQIGAAIRERPKTAHEMVSDLWTYPLAPFHHRFAVFEVLAHLEYMRRRGEVHWERSDGLVRWAA